MDYVIRLLEKEKKTLETGIREADLMHRDMRQASQCFRNIGELKRAIKVLKVKVKIKK